MIDKIAVTDPRIPIITVGTAFTADVVKKSKTPITPAPGESHYLIMQKPEYWCMRRMVLISIFLVLALLASGCIGGTGDQTVLPPLPGT